MFTPGAGRRVAVVRITHNRWMEVLPWDIAVADYPPGSAAPSRRSGPGLISIR